MSVTTLDAAEQGQPIRRLDVARAARRIAEAQQGRTLLWSAPALAAGIGLYFALPEEPGPPLAGAVAGLGLLLVWVGRGTGILLLAGVFVLGFALAKLQEERVAAPLLSAYTGEVTVTGRVVSVEQSSRARLVLVVAPQAIDGIEPARLPGLLRLSLLAKAGWPAGGTVISFKARLAPLPAPVEPGGFDYGRSLWLQGIGGTGRITSKALTLVDATPPVRSFHVWMTELRAAIGARIHAALAEPFASFAEALITGERSTIPREINRSLLVSGLFHILSISGLHMWLAAGGVFWTVRAALALVPALALRFPIRKWAAAAALLMGLFYMLLAEGGVATARSFIMVAIVFFAVIVDRPALSMRNLAIAALLVLVLDPVAAVEASFQMSFLAVLGLVAFYEFWSARRRQQIREVSRARHWALRLALWGLAAFAASLVTSLIAGFSSSLPAAYHFGRVSPYGVVANGLAIPVVGVLVMPFALIAVLLMPFGLEQLPLTVMGKGLELVILISNSVAALPGADEVIARPPELAMLTVIAGFLLLCLLSGWVRLCGAGVMVAGFLLMFSAPLPPDLLVDAAGQNVALRDPAGHLVPVHPRRSRFAVEKWLQANGEEAGLREAAKRAGWTCADGRCVADVRGRRVVFLAGVEGRHIDCAGAAVLIADFPLRGACRKVPLRIDRFDLWRHGAHAVRFGDGAPDVTTARGEQGERPWTVRRQPRRTLMLPRHAPLLD